MIAVFASLQILFVLLLLASMGACLAGVCIAVATSSWTPLAWVVGGVVGVRLALGLLEWESNRRWRWMGRRGRR